VSDISILSIEFDPVVTVGMFDLAKDIPFPFAGVACEKSSAAEESCSISKEFVDIYFVPGSIK